MTRKQHPDAELLDSIVENIPDMIFVKEAAELRFERFNRAGEALLGKSRDELLGKNDFDFFPREQAEFFQAKDRETLHSGAMVDIAEEPIDTPHGVRWLHTKKIPILDEHGQPRYLLGISEDITERKLAEEALRRAHDELEQRVQERTAELERSQEQLRQAHKMEAVGRLAGGVAHDFNNMLTAIISQASFLRARVGADAALGGAVAEIVDAAARAARLTSQLLAFSRQQMLQPRDVELGQILTGLEPMLRRLIGENIDLRARLEATPAWLHADPGQLEQVILNLAVNARDAMPEGGKLDMTVRASAVAPAEAPASASGRWVVLEVRDTGVGMDHDTLARIFEPFFTTKERGRGTGLGLATVYGIVSQSGGAIVASSQPGRGSCFQAYFPQVPAVAAAAAIAGGELTPTSRTGETILLVEDEDAVRRAIHAVLVDEGYEVLDARDGVEALRVLDQHGARIKAIVSDLVMPRMGGRELARAVATRLPCLRVLFMSGHAPASSTRLAPGEADGLAEAFLAKPFAPEALLAALRALLDRAERPAQPPTA